MHTAHCTLHSPTKDQISKSVKWNFRFWANWAPDRCVQFAQKQLHELHGQHHHPQDQLDHHHHPHDQLDHLQCAVDRRAVRPHRGLHPRSPRSHRRQQVIGISSLTIRITIFTKIGHQTTTNVCQRDLTWRNSIILRGGLVRVKIEALMVSRHLTFPNISIRPPRK